MQKIIDFFRLKILNIARAIIFYVLVNSAKNKSIKKSHNLSLIK